MLAISKTRVKYLKHHAAKLRGEQKLLALADQWINGKVLPHIVATGHHAVDTQTGVLLLHLARLDRSETLDRAQTRVLGQGHGHRIQRISKGTHGVLLNAGALDGSIFHGQRAGNLGSTATVHHTVVTDQVAHHTQGIV